MGAQKKIKSKIKTSSLRIIGGTWRSRRIEFLDISSIRPTPDRIRETIFNWLIPHIQNAHCLDLFAGSGALGFEAASRGAARVELVDMDSSITSILTQQVQKLKAENVSVLQQDALIYVQECKTLFDIIFLDPPFNSDLLENLISPIKQKCLTPSGLLYIESSSNCEVAALTQELNCVREKIAGQVRYGLYQPAELIK